MDGLVAFILDESKWLTTSMGIAGAAIIVLLSRTRGAKVELRHKVLAAMSLFFATTIGCMAFGHLLAVTVRLIAGTLEGSVPLLYFIGVVLAVPSWWLMGHTQQILDPNNEPGRRTLILNAWTGLSLVALGLTNLPLAAPAALNIGYQLHSRKSVGWLIVFVAVVIQLGLFAGSLIFLASGGSFEEFRGM